MADLEIEEIDDSGEKSKKGIWIAAIVIILLLFIGSALYMNLMFKGGNGYKEAVEYKQQVYGRAASNMAEGFGPIYGFEMFIVNLNESGGSRYLRLTMQIELGNKVLLETFEGRKAQLRDAIINILSSKTFEDVRTIQGKLALKQEIKRRVNMIVGTGAVENVFFVDFVVQ